jgi:tetratricopeptide (TPR) repeat protein
MFSFSKRFIYTLSNKIRQTSLGYIDADGILSEGKLTIDFAKTKKSPFDIKAESSYNSYLSNGSFTLSLKKANYIAWADMPDYEFQDHVIEAKIRLENSGNYIAAGIIFRIIGEDSYYLALVSNKGYFRLDVVKDNAPKTLIAWTEIPDFDGIYFTMKIITYGTYLIFLVNDKWLGEANDNSVTHGRLGFVLASYESADTQQENDEYVCKAQLDYISINTQNKIIEENFKKWTGDSNINAEERLRLAETFAVMGEPVKALDQIKRAWKRRDEVISAVSTTLVRTKKELLLAARMSFRTGQYSEAEEYIGAILDQWPDSAEGIVAHTEKFKILYELSKFAELKEFTIKNQSKINKDIDYYTLFAKCLWELKDYSSSAEAWDRAFEMNAENGIYAANAANAHESAGNEKEALSRLVIAGKIFLNQDNKPELAAIIPKLSLLGTEDWQARALTGKWLFSIKDYERSAKEFKASNKLRCALNPRPKADPALLYLWGLIYYIEGKIKKAIRLVKRAAKLAPDYELFRTKLEELMLIDNSGNDESN